MLDFALECALSVLVFGCSQPTRTAVSASDAGWIDPGSPRAQPSARPPIAVVPWDLPAQLALARPAVPRFRSGHLTGELEGDVLAASAGPYPKLGPDTQMPPGATLIERLFQPGSATPAAYFAMVKRQPGFDPAGGDWEYLVVSAAGQTEQRGNLPLCARCHAEAPHDHLFGRGR